MNIKSIILNFEDGKSIQINDHSFSHILTIGEDKVTAAPISVPKEAVEIIQNESDSNKSEKVI